MNFLHNTAPQQKAFNKLSKLKCGALFMKMGTGKTKVALDLAKSKEQVVDCLVWIAPASLLRTQNYKNEFSKWNTFTKEIYFFSVESISQSDFKYIELVRIAENKKCFCVVDESITIKNTEAGRTRRLLEISNKFAFRLILNGTACTKGLYDLYSQMQFLSPKILNMTETQFANRFLVYKIKGNKKTWKRWSKPANEQALIEIIRPYIFDCELEIDVNIKEVEKDCVLLDIEKTRYTNFKSNFLEKAYRLDFLAVAQAFQKHTSLAEHKKKVLEDVLQEIKSRREKAVIYCKFLCEVDYIKSKYDCIVLTGKEKGDLEKLKEKDLLVCTYGVGSFGLNLQMINNIIYFTQTFDYKDKEQSKHRAYRIGQEKDVNIYNLWINTGLDEIIKKSLDKKENTLKNVEDFIKNGKIEEL